MEQLFEERGIVFWLGFLLLLISVVFNAIEKHNRAIVFLLLAGFLFFLYSGVSIPILNVWDERFHALVAKNLMQHSLMPTLYAEELLKLPYRWEQSHIWVHKQPLFLWQAALSYKLFGVSEIAFRLPGIIVSTMVIYASYRVGKLLGNDSIGYCTGFLFVTSLYLWQLISGFAGLDQNDVVFMAYISLSIWSMVEYVFSGKIYWIILTGLFSGFAILTKWAVGLLIYLIWTIYITLKSKWSFKQYTPILISLLITMVIAVPWQLFIFKWYPIESSIEYKNNVQTFTSEMEGHGGPLTFHLNLIGQIYGCFVPYLLVPAFIVFYLKSTDKKLSISLICSIVFVYLFFSFAKTKMSSFTIVVALPIFLSMSFFIYHITNWAIQKIKFYPINKMASFMAVFFLIAFFRVDFNTLKPSGFWENGNDCYNRLKHNKEIFQKLKLPDNAVLFNIPGRHFIEAMFYTSLPAYGFIPDENQYKEIRNKGKRIALFMPDKGEIPAYIKNDQSSIILKDSLDLCE